METQKSNIIPQTYFCKVFHSKISFTRLRILKAPSNKTPALIKRMNMDIWVAGTSNQLFIRGY